MCNLCHWEESEREAAKEKCWVIQQHLRDLAEEYGLLATGEIDPHTGPRIARMHARAEEVIVELVNDWIAG